MRHLWSLVAGVAAAPATWLLLATGAHRSQATVDGWDAAGTYDTAELIGPAAFLVAAGVLLGVLGTLRWSPAGPIAAGVLLVVPTVVLFIRPFRLLDELPDQWRLLGQDLAPRLPIENGTLLMLGALMLMAAFSVQRWRRWPALATPVAPAADEPGVEAMPEPGPDASTTPQPVSDEEILAEARALEDAQAQTDTSQTETPKTETSETDTAAAEESDKPARPDSPPPSSS